MFTLHELLPTQGNSLQSSLPIWDHHFHSSTFAPTFASALKYTSLRGPHILPHSPRLSLSPACAVTYNAGPFLKRPQVFCVLGPSQSHLHRSAHTTLTVDSLILFTSVVATSQVPHKVPRRQSRYHLTATTNEGTLKMSS